jgi:hypothetical protein
MLVLVFRPEAAGRRWRTIILPLIAGPAIALAAWTPSALADLPQGFILPLLTMSVAVGFHFTLNRSDYWFIELLAALLLATFVLATGLERLADSLLRGSLWLLISWLLLSALFLRRIEGRHSLKENLPFLPASAYVFYVLGLTVVAGSHDISDALLVTSMLLPLTLLRITDVAATRYAAMIEDELALGDRYDRQGRLSDRCEHLEESYWANWLAILGFGMALIAAFFNLLDVRGVFQSLQFGLANTQPFALLGGFFVLAGTLGVTGIVLATASFLSKPTSAGELRLIGGKVADLPIDLGIGRVVIAYLACAAWAAAPWIVSLLTDTSLPEPDSPLFALYYVLCGIFALWMAVLSRESLEHNVASIEFAELRGPASQIPRAVGLANGSATLWLLTVGLWIGADISSMAVVGQYLLVVLAGSVLLAVLETLLLYRAMPDIGTRPRYIGLHTPPSHVGNDHILLGFLVAVSVVFVYSAAVVAHYVPEEGWAIVPLAISSPLVAIFALYAFFFALTNVNTSTHTQQEAGRIANALWPGRAATWRPQTPRTSEGSLSSRRDSRSFSRSWRGSAARTSSTGRSATF